MRRSKADTRSLHAMGRHLYGVRQLERHPVDIRLVRICAEQIGDPGRSVGMRGVDHDVFGWYLTPRGDALLCPIGDPLRQGD